VIVASRERVSRECCSRDGRSRNGRSRDCRCIFLAPAVSLTPLVPKSAI
jgi:hypothetical protein